MKIVFAKDVLLENLTPVMGTVSNKNTITSLEGVLIETLGGNTVRFSTYDMNKGTRTTFEAEEVIEEGSYIINAQRLMQIIRVMEDGEITIEVDNKYTVHIYSGKSSFTMYAISGSDFPGLPELSGDRGFDIEGDVLRDMIMRVMHSVAENDSRPNLCGVYFEVKGGRLTVVSCDSYTLSECIKSCEINSIGDVESEEFSFILPGHALNEMVKILADHKDVVKLYLARKHAILKAEDLVFFTRLIDGDYIDYKRIIPQGQTVFVKCDRERLLTGLERVILVADEKVQGSGRNYVKLEIKEKSVILTSTSSTGRVYDEIPCEHEGEDLVIGFNCRYLINSIRVANTDTLSLAMKSQNQAMIIRAAEEKEDESFFYMILPVRMTD